MDAESAADSLSDIVIGDGPRLDFSPGRTPRAEPVPGTPPPELGGAVLEDSDAFMPACLTIPGLQHICGNMCSEVHTSMSGWPRFWDQLKTLEAMLVISERRARYVFTCLRGRPLESKAHWTELPGTRLQVYSSPLLTPRPSPPFLRSAITILQNVGRSIGRHQLLQLHPPFGFVV